MRRKSDLPRKICASCGRPFDWRKKWERVWDEVKYCSDRCRATRKGAKGNDNILMAAPDDKPGSA